MVKMEQWAISSEASLETEMNVQRLLKLPKVPLNKLSKGGILYGNQGRSKP